MNSPALQLAALHEPVDYDPFTGGALERVVPTTEPQREIWLADHIGVEASLSFNLSVSLRMHGTLDVEALRSALEDLVRRHDALRASIGHDGESFCVVEPKRFRLPTFNLSALDSIAIQATLRDHLRNSVETPFAIATETLFRAELLVLAPEEHLLLMTAHHIACDGWSWWVIVRELGELYGLHCTEQRTRMPPCLSFAEYAMRERTSEGDPLHAADEAYWVSRFSDGTPVLELPTDRPRPMQRSFASAREDHLLDAALLAQLRGFAAHRGAGLFAILLTGFSALLSRLSGQEDVVVGIPVAGQPLAGDDRLVGHCVNLLPLRFLIDPTRHFAQALDGVQSTLLDALEHQRCTFGTLLKKLRVRRDPARIPLVSVLFNLDQALDHEGKAFTGLDVEFESNPRTFETFELFVNAVQSHGSLRLECQYNRDLFEAGTVRSWLQALETLLRAAVEREESTVAALPLVGGERFKELTALQPGPVAYDQECRMHEHFEAQCDRTPGRAALRFGETVLTYGDLERRANKMAHVLRASGIRRGHLVGLALDRGVDMLAALLGILKSGAGYVPLDPQFPVDRLSYMAADAGLAALVTSRSYADRFDLRGRPLLVLEAMEATLEDSPDHRIGRDEWAAQAEDIAYVIYTSGSTGRPKGVMVPHRAVSNFLVGMQRGPGLDGSDRLLAVTTLSFDIAVLELMLPLGVGAEVILADRESTADGLALRTLMARTRATAMQATPSTWRLLLDAGWRGAKDFKALCGGESLAPDLATALLERCGSLWNLYGPTETTVWSTCAQVKALDNNRPPDIHIGRPIANTRVWVLDAAGQLCPIGVPGELCIAGDGVSLGYLGRPDLTAERFVPEVRLSSDAGATDPAATRMYRTGDRGRWRHDGNLEHMGRLDHQVKVRGYRIELGEIEAHLKSRDEIARAIAIVREDVPGDQRIVAYVVPRSGAAIEESALRSHLRGVLPAYMVPQHFVFVDALPLLPNGKMDRSALPPPSSGPVTGGRAAPPLAPAKATIDMDERQAYLARVWSELLGLPAGPEDNFFDLGGHSMLAVQMANRVARDTGARIKLIRLGSESLAQVAASLPAMKTPPAPPSGMGARLGTGLRRLLRLPTGEPRP